MAYEKFRITHSELRIKKTGRENRMSIYLYPVIMTLILAVPFFTGVYLKKSKRLDSSMICWLVLLTGLLVRIIYISYTDINVRQHDVHNFFENNAGHAEYICYLFENRALPDFDPRDIFQFYHPPLHHIICALWLTVVGKLGMSVETTGVASLQFLTVMYSFLFTVFAYKTLKLLDIKPGTIELCTAAVTFHPTLIILSGSLNNDILSSLLSMSAIYFTAKWAKEQKWLDIVMIAFSIGLGMFTKLSVGLLAPGVAAVFLYVFIKHIKEFKKLVPQFLVFGIICVPIGLYWPVRNYVRFDVPLNYVPLISENSGQFIDRTPAERLLNWLPFQFASPFTQWEWNGAAYNEFNPIIALWKNAMFDEGTFFSRSITLQSFCTALFFSGIFMSLFSVFALFMMWFKNKDVKLENKILLTGVSLFIFGNYVLFCINYPHVCTENMRYCVPLIFVGAALLGMYIDKAAEFRHKYYGKSISVLKKGMAVFCGLSVFVYTAMMYYEAK